MIDIVNLHKAFRAGTGRASGVSALHDVSLRLPGGELSYLLGLNGAGKSTLLRCICGLSAPTSGRVTFGGNAVTTLPDRARQIGIHLEANRFPAGHTARRYLRWRAATAGVPRHRVDDVLDAVGMSGYADRRLGGFSLGMSQRIGIAAALLADPPVLLFDEPLNGLDIAGIHWARSLLTDLANQGRTVVVASHLLDEVARTADRIILLDSGRLIADAPLADFIGDATDLEIAYLAHTRAVAG
ncbi:putative ABC transporter ATP-binding protein [Gordonia effusa NBRC 100432]|uniref:Putative ABC transporter ATP-binding protein n=1 Tax=Gordonia effusa NBRC 100432 TaxID=1077974 RepID=H0QXI5_9ACTN|nr:ATP-binding cassette domain-containing protein [Gordonia effusa]GAB17536.1 putative ABC transporter ATP-binding protein [Gordonia effusa NBRC 100432]